MNKKVVLIFTIFFCNVLSAPRIAPTSSDDSMMGRQPRRSLPPLPPREHRERPRRLALQVPEKSAWQKFKETVLSCCTSEPNVIEPRPRPKRNRTAVQPSSFGRPPRGGRSSGQVTSLPTIPEQAAAPISNEERRKIAEMEAAMSHPMPLRRDDQLPAIPDLTYEAAMPGHVPEEVPAPPQKSKYTNVGAVSKSKTPEMPARQEALPPVRGAKRILTLAEQKELDAMQVRNTELQQSIPTKKSEIKARREAAAPVSEIQKVRIQQQRELRNLQKEKAALEQQKITARTFEKRNDLEQKIAGKDEAIKQLESDIKIVSENAKALRGETSISGLYGDSKEQKALDAELARGAW